MAKIPPPEALHQHRSDERKRRQWAAKPLPAGAIPLRHPPDLYEDHLIKTQRVLNDIFELWFGTALICAEQNKAAALVYCDEACGPIVHMKNRGYGRTAARQAIDQLIRAEEALKAEITAMNSEPHKGPGWRKIAERQLATLPFPLSLRFSEHLGGAPNAAKMLKSTTLVRIQLEHQFGELAGGNARAQHTALAVRAAYEFYCGEPVTVGYDRSTGKVTGRYCRCLEEVFETVGLRGKVVAYAEKARKRPESDTELTAFREYFACHSGPICVQPMIFTEFGWVENMTPRQKLFNMASGIRRTQE